MFANHRHHYNCQLVILLTLICSMITLTLISTCLIIGDLSSCSQNQASCKTISIDHQLNHCFVEVNYQNQVWNQTGKFCHTHHFCPPIGQKVDCYLDQEFCWNLDCDLYPRIGLGFIVFCFGCCLTLLLSFCGCDYQRRIHKRINDQSTTDLLTDVV